MQIPLQITFRGMEPSAAIESIIRERATRLERFNDRIVRCHVVVDVPHRHQKKGRLYAVRIDVTTPTGEIAATRDPPDDQSHQDLNVVLRDSFDAITRQLEDDVRRRRGDVKAHEGPEVARVVRLFPSYGFGFLVTPDEVEIYFHENSVVGEAFADLSVGDEVRYTLAPDESEKGPQASTVQVHTRARD